MLLSINLIFFITKILRYDQDSRSVNCFKYFYDVCLVWALKKYKYALVESNHDKLGHCFF